MIFKAKTDTEAQINPELRPEALSAASLVNAVLIHSQTPQALEAIYTLKRLIDQHQLRIKLSCVPSLQKLTQKYRQQLSAEYQCPLLIIDDKEDLALLINGISVAPEWAKLQRRIVSAGRKSELLLQAAKLNADRRALDATAGFGHDSLILASTGAQVTLVEREPLLALLLLAEQQKMAQQKNWQKLMSRLTIINNSAEDCLAHIKLQSLCYDTIYLDPMFPDDSYENSHTGKGAQVGKHMQALHSLVAAPTLASEMVLFESASQALRVPQDYNHVLETENQPVRCKGRLIVKRPISAPSLANKTPDEVWQNDVVRFDGYLV
ncbi:MAG: class I SAM-dependent methyltransferase [Psychrobacter sp.]|nr:class I SAM-dependent methyltransferase [Psychrobacter sp.]